MAQAQVPSLSPPSYLQQTVGNTVISVTYERPAARGREIFGQLVPFGQVWRTGAGYCTKITFSQPVVVAGQHVAAGKYALLSIPDPEVWTIMLNADTSLYGSRDYDLEKDVARFRVPRQRSGRFYESLGIELDVVSDNAELFITWGDTQVSFPIVTTTRASSLTYIDSLLAASPALDTDYAWPAEYLFYSRGDYNTVLALADKQLSLKVSEYPLRLKFEVFTHLSYHEKAREVLAEIFRFLDTQPYDEQNLAWSRAYWQGEKAKLEDASQRAKH